MFISCTVSGIKQIPGSENLILCRKVKMNIIYILKQQDEILLNTTSAHNSAE
jgi:hypothetical protein